MQRDRAGSATYEHTLLGLAGMSKSVLDFVISIQSWSDLEGNQVELVSQKKEFLFWDQFRLLVVKEEAHLVAEIEHLYSVSEALVMRW